MAIDLTNSIEISNRQSDRRTQSRLTNDIYGLLRICFATHISNSSLLPTIECRIYELYRETRSERGEEEKKTTAINDHLKLKHKIPVVCSLIASSYADFCSLLSCLFHFIGQPADNSHRDNIVVQEFPFWSVFLCAFSSMAI